MRSKSLIARIAWLLTIVRASGLPLPHHDRRDHQRGRPPPSSGRVVYVVFAMSVVELLACVWNFGCWRPSPLTRQCVGSLALALPVAALGFLFPVQAKAEPGSMTFRVAPLEMEQCGARCPHVIIADGLIETGTPLAFVDFLRAESSDADLRHIVYLNSRGGNVVASMDFGRILRELRMAAVVGRFEDDGAGYYVGECVSACVYAMMGAVKRVAPPGSEVALHRMSVVETESGLSGDATRVARSYADPPMVGVLKRYAQRMGVSPALVGAAESLPPDTVHVLTREEMHRWSFATGRTRPFAKPSENVR
jgi:hypothetical protein